LAANASRLRTTKAAVQGAAASCRCKLG
jgi:hypothetical protein